MNVNTKTLEQLKDQILSVLFAQRILRDHLERIPSSLVLLVQ
jgi:hypothetical protein